MLNRTARYIPLILSVPLITLASFSCTNDVSTSSVPATPTLSTVIMTKLGPPTTQADFGTIQVDSVSLVHETGLVNPAGPIIDIKITSKAEEPIVSLTMSLDLGASIHMSPTPFEFGISASNPLLPNENADQHLIAFGGGYLYGEILMTVEGELQSGRTFSYIQYVTIVV